MKKIFPVDFWGRGGAIFLLLLELVDVFENQGVLRIDFKGFFENFLSFLIFFLFGVSNTKTIKSGDVPRFSLKNLFVKRNGFRPVFFDSGLNGFFFDEGNVVKIHTGEILLVEEVLSQADALLYNIFIMSGHSKWSTIKHKKAATDAKKGAEFGRIAKNIYLAVKKGGSGDVNSNPYLRQVLDEARSANMPSNNVRRAIDKALGVGDAAKNEEITYEGYGVGGVGVMATCVTDNRNRTGGEIKTIFDKHQGSIGSPGSVSYLKSIDPLPKIRLEGGDLETMKKMLQTLEEHDDVVEVWSNLEGGDE